MTVLTDPTAAATGTAVLPLPPPLQSWVWALLRPIRSPLPPVERRQANTSKQRRAQNAGANRMKQQQMARSKVSLTRCSLPSVFDSSPPAAAASAVRLATMFHLLFKIAALAMYLFCSLFFDNFILGE